MCSRKVELYGCWIRRVSFNENIVPLWMIHIDRIGMRIDPICELYPEACIGVNLNASCGIHCIFKVVVISISIGIDGPNGVGIDECENISGERGVVALECCDTRFCGVQIVL